MWTIHIIVLEGKLSNAVWVTCVRYWKHAGMPALITDILLVWLMCNQTQNILVIDFEIKRLFSILRFASKK